MKTLQEVKEKMTAIVEEVQGIENGRMNAMLAPEPYDFNVDTMTARIRYTAQDWEKNHRGEIHGGAVAAMFDTAMGMSVLAYSEFNSVSTADLDVSFIRPFIGETFIFEVNIIHLGRKISRVRAVAKDQNTGKVLASATSNFVPVAR